MGSVVLSTVDNMYKLNLNLNDLLIGLEMPIQTQNVSYRGQPEPTITCWSRVGLAVCSV